MPERPRKRKNNKNKRKNNKNNKSELSDANSSANDIKTNIDCLNDEVGQSSVTQGSCELVKEQCNVDKLKDTLRNDEIKIQDLINENQLVNSENTKTSTCSSSIDVPTREVEVDVNNDFENRCNEEQREHNFFNKNEFENENTESNIINNIISDINSFPETVPGVNESDINIVNKHTESLIKYRVESPEQNSTKKCKLSNNVKSKSVDNDDSPTITEVTEEDTNSDIDTSLCVIDSNNVIITDADSDVEWQNTDNLQDSSTIPTTDIKILSVSTIPLNIAQCNQANTQNIEDESSLRNFLHTLNLSTNPEDSNTLEIKAEIEHIINREIKHRLRKRGLADDFLFQKVGPSRSLTVIDEEGSSESSITSRRQSYLSDKVSDNEELDDDVFANEVCQARKVSKERHGQIKPAHKGHSSFQAIPQECIRVDAKIKEPEITEARGDWSMKTTEKLTGAELVYLTDSSSSTSSLYDLNDDKDNADDTDVSVRMITPTIEVTDTEKFLTNTYLLKNAGQKIVKTNDDNNTSLSNNNTEESKCETKKKNDPHEIVIESTDNIETNLYVKEIADNTSSNKDVNNDDKIIRIEEKCPKVVDKYDLEIKVIKCELNDAINNLLKEVTSDSECVQSEDLLPRQDSSSSLGSSQCTAKYNPNHSSLNDVADIISESHNETYSQTNHVKEVYEHVGKDKPECSSELYTNSLKQPQSLKEVCLEKISSLPYGHKIIEELANVSERLQNISLQSTAGTKKIIDTSKQFTHSKHEKSKQADHLEHHSIPPPLQPRTSSFKITKDEYNQEYVSKSEPMYKCLSPSNKMLMEKTNTILSINNKGKYNDIVNIKSVPVHKSYNERKESYPLKSETGSRLLSLIRDTSLKSNSNSTLYKSNKNENLERISKIDFSEPFRSQYSQPNKTSLSPFDSYKKYTPETFRPIPPPKFRSFSSSFYESDDSSDLTQNSLRKVHNERRHFHYSTGNLSKDIENDVSSIQNMHRNYINIRDKITESRPRRPSLPKDLCDQQMEYIRQKEKEVDAEIWRLEREHEASKHMRNPRAPMISEESFERRMLSSTYKKPLIKDPHSCGKEKRQLSSIFNSSEEELHREKMYSEYISQMAEREKRREHKIIKITKPSPMENINMISKSMTALDSVDYRINNPLESEFITKAKERWNKFGITDPETEDEKDNECDVYREPKVIEHKIKVIDAGEEKDVKNLPSHLQEFVSFTVKDTDRKNSPGESDPEKPSAHVVVLCAVIILMLTVGRYFMRLIRNI